MKESKVNNIEEDKNRKKTKREKRQNRITTNYDFFPTYELIGLYT